MEKKKEVKIIFRCEESLKVQFEAVCKAKDLTPSQAFRQMMKVQVERYGIEAAQGDMLKKGKK